MSELKSLQRSFTEHLRNPDSVPVPEGMDPRRVGIYSDLIFSNVSSLLSDFFPVLKSVLTEAQWRQLVRAFFIEHQAETPYFPKIAEEFVKYLSSRQETAGTPPFLLELVHYEWVELHLFTSEAEAPDQPVDEAKLLCTPIALSEVAMPLAYRFPVHKISPDFTPSEAPADPSCLLAFRDKADSVRFFELQPLSLQLVQALDDHAGIIVQEWLNETASRLNIDDPDGFTQNAEAMLRQLNEEQVFRSAA